MRTTVGYTGGKTPNPTYESVCDGDGHTEALRIEYDEELTSYDELLEFFWHQYHGTSAVPQYKAAIWVHDEEQRQAALRSFNTSLAAAKAPRGRKAPAAEVLDAVEWYDAEEYHQKYYERKALRRTSPAFPGGQVIW